MAASRRYFVFLLAIFFLPFVLCLPEPGKKDLHFKKNLKYDSFSKTMNKGYSIAIKGKCTGAKKVQINWRLVVSECAERFSFSKDNVNDETLQGVWNIFANHSLTGGQEVDCEPVIHLKDLSKEVKELILPPPKPTTSTTTEPKSEKKGGDKAGKAGADKSDKESKEAKVTKGSDNGQTPVEKVLNRIQREAVDPEVTEEPNEVEGQDPPAGNNEEPIKPEVKKNEGEGQNPPAGNNEEPIKPAVNKNEGEAQNPSASKDEEPIKPAVKKNEGEAETSLANKDEISAPEEKETEKPTEKAPDAAKASNQVCVTKRDGVFMLIVNAYPIKEEIEDKGQEEEKDNKDKEFDLILNVEMKGPHGYLSASDWPLYPFYGFMSLLYVFYGIVWLIVSACQWRDLLRIQFWIGGVIALGMLEKAVFFSEYNNINITGDTNPGLTVFAELVSCVKRTLARILVIIVSMGFGIVKPRLGTTLHRVLGVGALYFILATIEGCFRALHPKSDPGRQQLIASIPLAVLDASICWWIFMSLVQTTRTLRIRRNLVKLSLYRHFTNTLIFAVLASVAYMIWSIKTHRFAKDGCITDWSELWLDEAFWHFLFSIVLLVIMVLWRPTANNQRYAFTPIVDFGDDDDDDDNMTLSDAFDGMKMRNVKNTPEVIINGDRKLKHKPDDDLKWVEENIPSSAADAVLPSVLDSDEELMTTKFEMSKME
ncbi:hypothetical protein ACROYT_G034658 [Oculina patagonica]